MCVCVSLHGNIRSKHMLANPLHLCVHTQSVYVNLRTEPPMIVANREEKGAEEKVVGTDTQSGK